MARSRSAHPAFFIDSTFYRLSFEHPDRYILAKLDADLINLGTAVVFVNDLVGEVRRAGLRKVLIVRETPVVLPREQDELVAKLIANLLPRKRGNRTARTSSRSVFWMRQSDGC